MLIGKVIVLDVLLDDDVKKIKFEIYDNDGILFGLQYFFFDGGEFEDGWIVNDFNIQKGLLLYLVLYQFVEKLNFLVGSFYVFKGQLKRK